MFVALEQLKSPLAVLTLSLMMACAGIGEGEKSSAKQGAEAPSIVSDVSDKDVELSVVANMACQCEKLIDTASRGNFSKLKSPQSLKQHHCIFTSTDDLTLGVQVSRGDQKGAFDRVVALAQKGYSSISQDQTQDIGSGSLRSFVASGSKSSVLVHLINLKNDGLIVQTTELLHDANIANVHPAYIDSLVTNAKNVCED
jgi:hypothetical protein